jgi:hypothetical protein
MEIDEKVLALVFIFGIIGLWGLVMSVIGWLMSPPKAKNNRFQGREFNNHED